MKYEKKWNVKKKKKRNRKKKKKKKKIKTKNFQNSKISGLNQCHCQIMSESG